MELTAQKTKKIFTLLKDRFGYANPMQSPRIEKIVISTGIGSITDKDKLALIQDRLAQITGQKAAPRQAKKSIAGFKLRAGTVVGYQVTLRGKRMESFLDRLIHVALPRTKDFRGLERGSLDAMGNLTLGIREHTVFPETSDEDLKNVFGFAVTIVTTAKDKKEAEAFFTELGMPFKREE